LIKFLNDSENTTDTTASYEPNISRVEENTSVQPFSKIRDFLILGKREDAIAIAKSSQLWTMALVIATHVSQDAVNSVLLDYGNSLFSKNDPLHSIVTLFGNGFKITDQGFSNAI
jgi:hypothetical protein